MKVFQSSADSVRKHTRRTVHLADSPISCPPWLSRARADTAVPGVCQMTLLLDFPPQLNGGLVGNNSVVIGRVQQSFLCFGPFGWENLIGFPFLPVAFEHAN